MYEHWLFESRLGASVTGHPARQNEANGGVSSWVRGVLEGKPLRSRPVRGPAKSLSDREVSLLSTLRCSRLNVVPLTYTTRYSAQGSSEAPLSRSSASCLWCQKCRWIPGPCLAPLLIKRWCDKKGVLYFPIDRGVL
jgi:hypothetical protein